MWTGYKSLNFLRFKGQMGAQKETGVHRFSEDSRSNGERKVWRQNKHEKQNK